MSLRTKVSQSHAWFEVDQHRKVLRMRQSEKSDAYYAVSHVDTFALEEKLEHSQASQPRVRSTRKQILLILCVCGCTLLAWLFALLSITSTSKFSPSCVSDLLSPNSRETSIARRVDKILKSAPLIGEWIYQIVFGNFTNIVQMVTMISQFSSEHCIRIKSIRRTSLNLSSMVQCLDMSIYQDWEQERTVVC